MSGYQCNGLWFQCKRFWQQCKRVLWAGGKGGGGAAGEWGHSTRADIHAAKEEGLKTKENEKTRKTGRDKEAMQGDGGTSVKDHSL